MQSQIVIDNNPPYNTATYLIDNVLLGGGIIVSNHSFIGDPNQIGFFNGLNSNLGIDSGIVLSSGSVLDLIGPNASGGTSTDFSLPGDPTLDVVIAPDPTNDAAVLEFDFTPTSDTISFKYVFGSEEYLEWVNSFNDAFGFFLTGPNPAGGNYVNQNLAIVPGTVNTPVTIDNVNDIVNSAYYIDNGDGFTAPQNTDPTVIQFDGFTTPLTAIAAVNCGDTYHIKLVVADAVDGAYDSGIFLEAGSFYSPTLSVVDNLGIDSVIMLIECSEDITLTADAGFGATYEWFDSTSVVFSTDSFVEVNAGVYVVAATIAGCTIFSDTLEVLSGASDSLPPTSLNCVVESDGVFYFDWEHPFGASAVTNYQIMASSNIGGTYFNISVLNYPLTTYSHDASLLPLGTQFFYITTASVCLETLTSDTISPIYFSISQTNVNCWDDTDGSIQVSVEDFINVLSYDFYLDGDLNLNAHPLDTFFNNVSAGSHIITVADNSSGCLLEVPITISAPGYPLQALASSEVAVCHGGSSGVVVGSSAGGTPGYIYSWYESGNPVSFSDNDTAVGLIAGSYYLSVEDANGCDTFTTVNVIEPQFALQGSVQIFGVACKGDNTGMLVGDAGGGWGPYAYYWLDDQGDTLQYSLTHVTERDTLFDLLSGIYVLHIYDIRGCFVDYVLNVPEPSVALSIDSMVLVESISC